VITGDVLDWVRKEIAEVKKFGPTLLRPSLTATMVKIWARPEWPCSEGVCSYTSKKQVGEVEYPNHGKGCPRLSRRRLFSQTEPFEASLCRHNNNNARSAREAISHLELEYEVENEVNRRSAGRKPSRLRVRDLATSSARLHTV
jgi:hypothetical protein